MKKKDAGKLNVVTPDLWDQFFELCVVSKGSLSSVQNDGCWHTLIDEFCAEKGLNGF
jgi:hypothetical protein